MEISVPATTDKPIPVVPDKAIQFADLSWNHCEPHVFMKYLIHKSILIKISRTKSKTLFILNVFIYDLFKEHVDISLICDTCVTTQDLGIFVLLV